MCVRVVCVCAFLNSLKGSTVRSLALLCVWLCLAWLNVAVCGCVWLCLAWQCLAVWLCLGLTVCVAVPGCVAVNGCAWGRLSVWLCLAVWLWCSSVVVRNVVV